MGKGMNTVSNYITMPYLDYGYPGITDISGHSMPQFQHPGYNFNNNSFSKGFRHSPLGIFLDENAGLYTREKKLEPLTMQTVGTAIDLYA